MVRTVIVRPYVLREDGAYALVLGWTPVPLAAPQYWAHAVQFDAASLTVTSSALLGENRAEPTHLQLQLALHNGGIFVAGPAELYAVNASTSVGFQAGANAARGCGSATQRTK